MTALVVVLLGVCGWIIGQQLSSSSAPHHKARPASPRYATFTDSSGLFSGGYPASWKRIPTSSPGVVLLAEGPNGASYLVQKDTLTTAVGTGNIGAAVKYTEKLVKKGSHVKFLKQPQELTVDGFPALLYLYTFVDPTTGDLGAHAHYFIFDGKTMVMLVFQSLPSQYFSSEAHTFDSIAGTFTIKTASTP